MTSAERDSFVTLVSFANSMGSDIVENIRDQRDSSEILWKIEIWKKTVHQIEDMGHKLAEDE